MNYPIKIQVGDTGKPEAIDAYGGGPLRLVRGSGILMVPGPVHSFLSTKPAASPVR